MDQADLDNRFTFHPATDEQGVTYKSIRDFARHFAMYLNETCPDGREKALAVTKLEEAVFWANAAIARHHEDEPDEKPVRLQEPSPVVDQVLNRREDGPSGLLQ